MSEEEINIPEISDGVLRELAEIIKPVIRRAGDLFYVKDHKLRKHSFTWLDPQEKASGLKEVARIHTLHGYGYPGLFKPSVGEVLAQLPPEYLSEGVVAFETQGPDTPSEFYETEETRAAFEAGFHTAETILYRKTS